MASLNISSLFEPLVLVQDFVWLYPIIGCCICVNEVNIKDTRPTRVSDDEHYRIQMEVSTNFSFLRIGILPCAPSPATPSLQWEVLPLLPQHHVFRFNWSLQMGFTPPHTSLTNNSSGCYTRDLQELISYNDTCALP